MRPIRLVGASVGALALALSGALAAGASGSTTTNATATNATATNATTAGVATRDNNAAQLGAASYTPPALTWGQCPTTSLRNAGAECSMVTVPRDYAQPKGAKIKLAISRIKASDTSVPRQGVMLVNPGGPGGSGLEYSRLWPAIPDNVGASYDWIGFDPRGVGHSVPNLSCDGDYFGYNRPDYVPTTEALERTWLKKSAGYAAKCDKVGGALLEHMKSTDWAMDMDSIRKALGEKQINYYGFSYGTYLGQVYSSMYPNRVRRMIWDGVVNPDRAWYAANLDQDIAFDKNMDIYFTWIAKNDATYHLGTTLAAVKGTYYETLKKLRTAPEAGGTIGPDEWTDAFLSAGYYVYGWTDLAAAYAAAINDDNWAPIKEQYDGANGSGPGSDNTFAVYNAVQCTDTQWPRWKQQRLDNWRVYGQAPFETWANAWYNAPCLTWGAKAGSLLPIKGGKVPPILLIGETNDAATPFTGALRVRQLYPRSVLIEGVDGSTHSGSLSGIACTDDKIAAYLKNGALPTRTSGAGSDVKCPPVPQPDPAAARARAIPGHKMAEDLRSTLQRVQR